MLTSALRKAYGAAPKHHDLYADETEAALWTWELTNPSIYIEPTSRLKDVLHLREQMQSSASLIQELQKLIAKIDKAKLQSDLTAVSAAHAKYIKVLQKRKETNAKLQAKAIKEQVK